MTNMSTKKGERISGTYHWRPRGGARQAVPCIASPGSLLLLTARVDLQVTTGHRTGGGLHSHVTHSLPILSHTTTPTIETLLANCVQPQLFQIPEVSRECFKENKGRCDWCEHRQQTTTATLGDVWCFVGIRIAFRFQRSLFY